MTAHIALLRGVNVGGNKMVAMADLRALLADLKFDEPRTLLQSGNLVFKSPRKCDELKTLLEAQVLKRLGLATNFFLRTAKEWDAIIAGNPFAKEAKDDPGHLLVFLLHDVPSAAALKRLAGAYTGREKIHGGGKHLYATFPHGIARSKLTTKLIDDTLATRCTGRNWNTVLKLSALANG